MPLRRETTQQTEKVAENKMNKCALHSQRNNLYERYKIFFAKKKYFVGEENKITSPTKFQCFYKEI
ncbi:hypothetical protein CLI82_05285 [Porphyromonas gingivalis]|nr:hypothetical protein CLI82_05285 [Porphyromonas gingivalis]